MKGKRVRREGRPNMATTRSWVRTTNAIKVAGAYRLALRRPKLPRETGSEAFFLDQGEDYLPPDWTRNQR